jgi:hypothetical protein
MKQIRPFIGGLIACSIALALITTAAAQNTQQGIAKVVYIKGSARYLSGANTTWQPLKNGAILKPGSIVQTASDSYVDVVLNNPDATGIAMSAMSASSASAAGSGGGSGYHPRAEQDAVRIFENTVLGIDKLTVDQTGADVVTETQLDLKAGSIFGTVKKLSAASKYEVKIPNGVAGIRGTIYWMSADGVLRVLTGSVVYAYFAPDGKLATVTVEGGYEFNPRSGQPPQLMSNSWLDQMKAITKLYAANMNGPIPFSAPDCTIHYVSNNR